MKILPIFLSLSLASVALAQEPAELVKLRKTWKDSQVEAKKKAEEIYRSKNTKANKLYYEELCEMKDNFMEAKNLQGAIAVDAEIKKLVELHGKQKFEASSPLDGAWLSYSNKNPEKYLRVFSRGFMAIGREGGRILKWSLENGIVVIDFGPQRWEKLTFDPDNPTVMTGLNNAGSKITYERVKW